MAAWMNRIANMLLKESATNTDVLFRKIAKDSATNTDVLFRKIAKDSATNTEKLQGTLVMDNDIEPMLGRSRG